ncbi:MAG TPA: HEAT repeat domain-containing protein [Gemmatimonadaceae bacterium]|nr:HEAT repeat domain-containing protein [Gemmatimonadaceae bacterium]
MFKLTSLLAVAVAASVGGSWDGAPFGSIFESSRAVNVSESFRTVPPAALFPNDSADSLYRVARKALNDGDYGRAARIFEQIADDYGESAYAGDALYWRAFALYRRGGTDDLHDAIASLQDQRSRYPSAATRGDASALETRIRGELARRGEAQAAEAIHKAADSATQGCPSDDDDMRVAALNALMQMDADQALPVLKKVLARRDACSESLRRKAVFLVSQKNNDESANILLGVARSDPSADVRGQAIFWLGQVPGDRSVALLDSVLRSSKDEELQRKAIFALSQHPGERAGQILRDLATRKDVSEETRARVILALGQMRGSEGDVGYLRELFPTLESQRLKEQVLMSVAQSGSAENRRWLLDVATDSKQNVDVRKKALFWAGQSGMPIAEIVSMYGRLPDQELKEQMIFVLSQRNDSAATDKLIDIAKHDPDVELRKKAIFWLGQRDDPRVRKLLEELITNDSL